jgi:hypothetical protein
VVPSASGQDELRTPRPVSVRTTSGLNVDGLEEEREREQEQEQEESRREERPRTKAFAFYGQVGVGVYPRMGDRLADMCA